MLKKQNGITLVALVITIIILLILATISIHALFDSDLIGRAKQATDKHNEAADKETKDIDDLDSKLKDNGNKKNGKLIIDLTVYDIYPEYDAGVIKGDCVLAIYKDENLTEFVKRINITSDDYDGIHSYVTDNTLEAGTYYVVEESMKGYNLGTYICDIIDGEENVWTISHQYNYLVPSSGPADLITHENEKRISNYEEYSNSQISVSFKNLGYILNDYNLVDDYTEYLHENSELFNINIYEVATYDKDNDKYIYREELYGQGIRNITTTAVTSDNDKCRGCSDICYMLKEELDKRGVEFQNIKEGEKTYLKGNGVYLITFDFTVTDYYQYYSPSYIFVPALYENENTYCFDFDTSVLWYEKILTSIEIYNNVINPTVRDNETFVYNIRAYKGDEQVFSKFVSMVCDLSEENQQHNIVLEDIVIVDEIETLVDIGNFEALIDRFEIEQVYSGTHFISSIPIITSDIRLGDGIYSEFSNYEENYKLKGSVATDLFTYNQDEENWNRESISTTNSKFTKIQSEFSDWTYHTKISVDDTNSAKGSYVRTKVFSNVDLNFGR